MTFADYYRSRFRGDLHSVIQAVPRDHDFGPGVIALQPRTVSAENPAIRNWRIDQRAHFASALFLTVLVDQVCYTYFQAHYNAFRAFTQYPKWRGDCPGACYCNIDPALVFEYVGRRMRGPDSPEDRALTHAVASDTVSTMEHEIRMFCTEVMPALNSVAFWEACEPHIAAALRR
jgi:hypothetical protein